MNSQTIKQELLNQGSLLGIYLDVVSLRDIVIAEETTSYLKRLLDYDKDTYLHSIRVAVISYTIASSIDEIREFRLDILHGGLLHDIGKILVPIDIINKPGRLSSKERKIIDLHSSFGYGIIAYNSSMSDIIKYIILNHHENYISDSEKNDMAFTLVAVADIFDALTTDRPYKSRLKCIEAIAILKENENYRNVVKYLENLIKDH